MRAHQSEQAIRCQTHTLAHSYQSFTSGTGTLSTALYKFSSQLGKTNYRILWNTVRGSGLAVPAAVELLVFLPDPKKVLRLIESLMLSTTSGINVVAFAVRSRTLNTAFWLCLYSSTKMSVMHTVEVLICAK